MQIILKNVIQKQNLNSIKSNYRFLFIFKTFGNCIV